jgi:hypothetical protein
MKILALFEYIFLERTAKALPLFLLVDEKKKQSSGLVF